MNITASKIQYIQNNNVKTFKIPKEDRNINFKNGLIMMSYNILNLMNKKVIKSLNLKAKRM